MRHSAWILIGSFVLLGCGDDDPVTPPPPPPAEHAWEADLEGLEDWEHLDGQASAEFTEGETQFTATAAISGDEPEAVRPWHVHFNSCEAGGGIVGLDGDYPRLEVGAEGTAEAAATVPEVLVPEAEYHVNVHLSEAEMGVVIMCGDLILTD